ncbi:Predicted phage phi-C31 gp36 major capsid-like protein [Acidipropionibacterium jensenii]|uniref:Predicted phage phi-C31 gp36 major capsid-like protein n=1 Tax=Acidipropionibacterium jensenii TaxID=1749 RepID=A0A3S4V390_9ACTN|nr:phage major capsid protein [Acidipropionibacterium jensenii]VEI03742.1 Predicted phage phi-C31 gp36 major capsid-like protein [Acidipropionibacterium jensenii]
MSMLTTNAKSSFLPDQIEALVVKPVIAASVAIQAVGSTAVDGNVVRVPIVDAFPTASWTDEGAEIVASDASLGEVASGFYKLAGLSIVSSELAEDSNPDILNIVGQGLSNDIAASLDKAFFGSHGKTLNMPKGLKDLTGVNKVTGALANLDVFLEAIYGAQGVGANLATFVANPADALKIAKLKESTSSNRGLVQPDPTRPGVSQVSGVPVLPSPAVTEGEIWGLPGAGRVVVAIRKGTELATSSDAMFTSDRLAIRATMRAAFLFPHEAAIQKITLS